MQKSLLVLLTLLISLALSTSALAVNNPSIQITGAEQSSGGIWDHGTVAVTVNGYSETVSYGQFSTTSSIASAIAAKFAADCMAPVNARADGAFVTFQMRGTGSFSSVSTSASTSDPSHFSQASFQVDTSLWSVSTPYIVAVSPNQGPAGTLITISGGNFGATRGSSSVTINGSSVSPLTWDSGTVIVSLPANVSSGNVVITVGGVASNGIVFTVTGGSCQL